MSTNAKPRVVTLCGSTRFQQAFDLLNAHLSLQGDIVISCGLFGHTDTPQGAKFLTSDGNEQTDEKVRLDELHKRKIDLADCIYVVNVGGYVGSSTKSEIAYAVENGKPVHFMFPLPGEHNIDINSPYPDEMPIGRDPVKKLLIANQTLALSDNEPAPYSLGDLYTRIANLLDVDRDRVKKAIIGMIEDHP